MSLLADLEPLSTTWGAYAFVVLLGLLWGSFANVCIYRMPNKLSVVAPGSHCFACKAPVKWYDNVPLLSYVWLGGKCRACKAPFSARYLLVEALTGALFGLAWWFAMVPTFNEPFAMRLTQFGVDAAFILVMVVIAFIDLDTKLILNRVTYPSMAVFYGLGLLLPGRLWWEGLVGAFVGWGVPWLIGWLYMKLRKMDGLGLGDADLLGVIGALFGWKGAMAALFGGSVIGIAVNIPVLVIGRLATKTEPEPEPEPDSESGSGSDPDPDDDEPSPLRTEIPFGPYLVAAALLYMFAEPWIQLNVRFGAG